ncbi:MAG: zinc-dependent alcohol dehydrogenase family protein [Gammaproteobacteria bacterium]|nr:zinc-dependent alcohol dehydrogenase family protein [Gammaproteobacteria bacterium]MCW8958210.1 zinc-dependent alcohol dehydrogenase family protein [Gammaproteobacteria bacterium]MCW8973359.1 zinc-dependent alcohol dehydrogenase family protein [Gammaproteobacteria bacterium]MCW8992874.1 zinc-dependent alcohol dehydrogenase family protein [Gammaproteobacteria bacterium]
MRAVLMHQSGSPDVLLYSHEVEPPRIHTGHQVLVRLKAAGVNPIDTKLRSRGTYYPEQMPAILGCDGAGVVEEVGEAVTRFRTGDEVYFCQGGIGGEQGNYAELNVVDERFIAKKPRNVDFVTAAAAPLALITAWEALHDRARIEAGQKVLVHAGAGGVGHVAIQLAKAAGCQVITTVSSKEKAEFVRQLGADETLIYPEVDVADTVTTWSGGDGVDVVLDAVGGKVFEQSFAATRPYGHIVSLLQPAEVDWKVARLRNLSISLELMLSPIYFGWFAAQEHQAWILEQCAQLIDEAKLSVRVSHTLPLEEAANAHELLESGGMQGKVVLTI